MVVHWSGEAVPSALAARFAASGVQLAKTRGGAALLTVLSTEGDDAPEAPAGERPWIWLCARPPHARAVAQAVAAGAYDVIAGGDDTDAVAARLLARVAEIAAHRDEPPEVPGFVLGSAAGERLRAELAHAARTSMPVLLTGETGTGKEICARLLHDWSARRERRFVPINCAAIPNELLESELFGYSKGAFSGAVRTFDGQLAAAEGGTVFLDEVDDTPLPFQVKLLRVLEDRVVSRLGENSSRKVDFRILAATNRDLRTLVARGLFGADLFERLAIVSIRLPPLRERREDVAALTMHMIRRFYGEEPAATERHHVTEVTSEALSVLESYAWPGNVRELRNVVFGALVRKRAGAALLVSDLPARLLSGPATPVEGRTDAIDDAHVAAAIDAGAFNLKRALERLERAAVSTALARTGGNATAAAALLGEVGRGSSADPGATVRAMMKRLGLEGPVVAGRPLSRRRAASS